MCFFSVVELFSANSTKPIVVIVFVKEDTYTHSNRLKNLFKIKKNPLLLKKGDCLISINNWYKKAIIIMIVVSLSDALS